MSCVVHYQPASFNHSNVVGLSKGVSVVHLSYGAMHPTATIFILDRYCRPFGERKVAFASTIALDIFFGMSLGSHNAHNPY